jgi:hypothetical protein
MDERLCQAVSPNDEPCGFPATVHCATCGRWFCDAHAEDQEWHSCMRPAEAVEKVSVTLPGTVEKIIPSISKDEPEKAQINVKGAEDLYREIRVDNILTDADGKPVSLKKGADVEVTIEADANSVKPKE